MLEPTFMSLYDIAAEQVALNGLVQIASLIIDGISKVDVEFD